MEKKSITFDEVFKIWFDAEVMQIEGRDILPVAQSKGFTSIAEWRLSTALRLEMDKKEWTLETIDNPSEVLPNIIIGPYKGWSHQNGVTFFENNLDTTFKQALEIPSFFEWCSKHDRIIPLTQNFPAQTTVIVYRKPSGELIHIEGGHRMCAVAYSNKIGKPIDFTSRTVSAAIADITEDELARGREFLKQGTDKQKTSP